MLGIRVVEETEIDFMTRAGSIVRGLLSVASRLGGGYKLPDGEFRNQNRSCLHYAGDKELAEYVASFAHRLLSNTESLRATATFALQRTLGQSGD